MANDGNGNGRKMAELDHLIKLLSRGLSRLAVAAQGVDGRLDGLLAELRKLLRKDVSEAGQLQSLVDAIDARIKDVDDERSRHAHVLQEALERLITQLLAVRPAREITRDLKSLQKTVRDVHDGEGVVPALFSLATLQGQILNSQPPRPSLLSRWLGAADSAAAKPVVSMSVPASEPDAESVTSVVPATIDQALSDLVPDHDSAPEAEAPFSRISTAVCAVINQLLRQIEPPPQAEENHRNILERISSGLNWYELVSTLEDLSFVVLAVLERDRGEFHQYLLQLNQRLATATQVLQASKEHQSERRESDNALNEAVRNNIAAMQQQVVAATDIHALKSEVASRLDSVVKAMDSHQLSEQQRQVAMEEYLTVLEQRIQIMGEQSLAMEQQIVEQRRLALVDILTQLPNRSAYDERLDYEVDRWMRYRRPLALAVCDVDRFKTINDSFGHLAGDKVLKILAKTLRTRLRKTDFVARFGGEEFVVLMPETSPQEALRALDMVREAVATCHFHFRDQPLKITLSIGIATFAEGDDATAVFERADRALYRAKEAGRDRCELDSQSQVQ